MQGDQFEFNYNSLIKVKSKLLWDATYRTEISALNLVKNNAKTKNKGFAFIK